MSESETPNYQIVPVSEITKRCWFLAGATASGKSEVSLELASRINAEIVSMDSMAIYRLMDVGTAKPTVEQRAAVPHHLVDIVDPDEIFSTSRYHQMAHEAVADIWSRGKEVLFVGGTALYLKAVLRGLFQGPPADWDFRKEIEADLEEFGDEYLHQRLELIDPISAHNLHQNDHRRIIRALEVFKTTGKPLSHLQMEFDQSTAEEDCRVFALRHARPILHQRIEQRVTTMFEKGLLEEVVEIRQKFETLSRTAAQAVGYKEAMEYLDQKISMDEAVERMRVRTRRFARHQETWFRGLTECRMVDLEKDFGTSETVDRLLELARTVS